MKGSDKERDAERKQQNPLDDAQGAGLEPDDELQVVAESEHPGTDEKSQKVSDSPGKQELDHGQEPSTDACFPVSGP